MSEFNRAPTVRDLVLVQLKAGGYEGLVHEDRECACALDDLMPCEDQVIGCEAGWKGPCGEGCNAAGDCDWHITTAEGEAFQCAHGVRRGQPCAECPGTLSGLKLSRLGKYTEERCHAASDGECFWEHCPQLLDGEPRKSGRHCPIDRGDDD